METLLPMKLTPQQVYQLQSEGPQNLILIDLRDFEVYQKQHIPGSEWYPVSQVDQLLKRDIGDRLMILICAFEVSVEALLRSKQIKQAVVLSGGMEAWVKDGFPTICLQSEQTKTKLNKVSE